MMNDYLKRILNARVYDVAEETPLEPAPVLSARLGHRVLLKREDLQPVFSFKLRGAYNRMIRLTEVQRARGVITASAGNHAQGLALSARRLGCRAVIVMPRTTPQLKVDAVAARGAEICLHGESYSDAYAHALGLQDEQGLTFVHPFNDPDVIAGQGTIGVEILRQHPGSLDAVFVAIGGGGLASGVAAYIKAVRPEVRVFGVQTRDSAAMCRSLQAGTPIELTDVGLFSDGTAVRRVGDETFRLCRELLDGILLVDTDAICAAVKDVFLDSRSVLEPAGALALAGLKAWVGGQAPEPGTASPQAVDPPRPAGQASLQLVAVTSGANMNFDRLGFVSERADVGQAREALFAVTIPEERGSFRRFCRLLGPRSVTEFNYRISDASAAHIFVGVQISKAEDTDVLLAEFEAAGFHALDLSGDELAQTHLRHMVGGRSGLADDEIVLRCEFPERPGALARFLEQMNPGWNISMFHYRYHGVDHGQILVGVQVPADERASFRSFMTQLGYRYQDESDHPAYRMFLATPRSLAQ